MLILVRKSYTGCFVQTDRNLQELLFTKIIKGSKQLSFLDGAAFFEEIVATIHSCEN